MRGQLERSWRILATGFCFAMFGLGGITVRGIIFPGLLLIPSSKRREHFAKNLIHYSFLLFVKLMVAVRVMTFEVRGKEKLRRSGLFILANHPSLIDVVLLIALVRRPDCVVKSSLWRNPFTWGPVRIAAFIRNDSGPALVADCIHSVHSGNNLIIFPEGTRTRPGAMQYRFQRGAANVAVRGQLPITPVLIHCSEPTLTKGEPWYRVPRQRPHFCLTIADDLPVSLWQTETNEPAQQTRALTQKLEHYFKRETLHG